MYQTEHWFAWLTGLVAIGLGVFAALIGFGVIEGTEAVVSEIATDGEGAFSNDLADGFVLAFPALAAAVLSYSMHRAEHHRRRAPLDKPETEQALWSLEHMLSMLAGLVAISLGVVAILVGYDVFDRGNIQADGYLWGILSIGSGVMSLTFHTVAHHQIAQEDDYLVRIVDERVRLTTTPPQYEGGTTRERGTIR
jgi:hypothetical protein